MKFLRIFLLMNLIGFLLSMASVRFRISYTNELKLKISYLFFSYTVFPKKKKPPKAEKAKTKQPEEKKKENLFLKVYHEKGLKGLLHLLKALADMAGHALKTLFQHIRVKLLSLHVAVAEEDAAKTALTFGEVCGVVYPTFSVLTETMKCSKFEVAVEPDFQAKKTKIQGKADLKIRVAILLMTAIQALIRYMKTIKSAKISDKTKSKKAVQ